LNLVCYDALPLLLRQASTLEVVVYSDFCSANGVNLHYLDWGGQGATMLLLPGLGFTAAIYTDFAPHFTDQFRVLALTRRGHGQSDKPPPPYDIDTLTDDIAAFLAAMQVEEVTLVGHSFAGDELTRFATRYADYVTHLVYLDAAYNYAALVNVERATPSIFSPTAVDRASLANYKAWLYQHIFGFWSPSLEADLQDRIILASDGTVQFAMPEYVAQAVWHPIWHRDYTAIQAPALAFYAWQATYYESLLTHLDMAARMDVQRYFQTMQQPWQQHSMEQFQREMARGQVVELSHTQHLCFIHRQEEVIQAMRQFLH
jgi:pimeloyl-ACP methyl ester carboxylesterase